MAKVTTVMRPSPEELARKFWDGTGLHNVFPRKIEQAIALKLPLALVKPSQLTVSAIGQWLQQRDIAMRLPADPRNLCGCLVAHRGRGLIFVCGLDSPEEQRLTIAHEVAHFLIDYLWPRQQVIRALGQSSVEVLDGLRPPTPAERAAAILSHLRLGAHVHVLPRLGSDEDTDVIWAHTEDRADRLAFELVAPRECIRSLLGDLSACQRGDLAAIRTVLATHFGLPAYAFDDVIQRMMQRRPPSFVADIIERIRRQ